MDITHVYTKTRREFGKPCSYKLTPPEILVHIPSTPEDADQWTPRVFTHVPIQTAPDMTEHTVNTESVPLALAGVHHSEGGWPKEIDHREEEHTARYRKKVERDQKFLDAVEATSARVTGLVELNNALDITTAYFPSDNIKRDSVASMQSVAVMRDVCRPTRAARYISWGPMVSGTHPPRRVAVSYSTLDFQRDLKSGAKRFQTSPQLPTSSYVWDLSNPGSPEFEVANPTSAITVLKFSPKDSHVLVGGMYNGLIGVWDMRKGHMPLSTTPVEKAHRAPVFNMEWVKSKAGSECCSVSTDGRVLWWDIRKLADPIDSMTLSLGASGRPSTSGGRRGSTVSRPSTSSRAPSRGPAQDDDGTESVSAVGGSALNYSPAAGLNKFLVGTETGHILACNRKAKSDSDRVTRVTPAHYGPITSIDRSPFFAKYYLTTGDWTLSLWNDDSRTPLYTTPSAPAKVTACGWSPSRPGVYFAARADGYLDIYDLSEMDMKPLSLKVSDRGVTCASFDPTGTLLLAGTADGALHLYSANDYLSVQHPGEKSGVQQMLERELKVVKNLEHRAREQRIKETKASNKGQTTQEISCEFEAYETHNVVRDSHSEMMEIIDGMDW